MIDQTKRIGFIIPTPQLQAPYDPKDVFFHFNNLKIPLHEVSVNNQVNFRLKTKGDNVYNKPSAITVCRAGEIPKSMNNDRHHGAPRGLVFTQQRHMPRGGRNGNMHRVRSASVHSQSGCSGYDYGNLRNKHGGSVQSLLDPPLHQAGNRRGSFQSFADLPVQQNESWHFGTIVQHLGQLQINPNHAFHGKTLPFTFNQVCGQWVNLDDQVRFKVDKEEKVVVLCLHKEDAKLAHEDRTVEDSLQSSDDSDDDETFRQLVYQNRSKVNSGSKIKTSNTGDELGIYGTSSNDAYLTGRIISVKDTNAFIKPMSELPDGYNTDKDVYLNVGNVRSAGLKLIAGDIIRFSLSTQDKMRPMAIHASVLKFKQKWESEVVDYIDYATERLQATDNDQGDEESEQNTIKKDKQSKTAFLVELVSCTAVWRCLGDPNEMSLDATMAIVELALLTETLSKGMKQTFRNVLIGLMESRLFNAWFGHIKVIIRDVWDRKDQSKIQLFQTFFQLVFKYIPEKSRSTVPLLKHMVDIKVKPLTQEAFLFSALKEVCKLSGSSTTDMEWDDIPLVPSQEELLTPPDADYMMLSPVTNTYNSAEEYLDTYFRLLRTDCFHALRKGIKALLRGTLDSRDMKVYVKVAVAGFNITKSDSGLVVVLKVTPQKAVKNWKTCSNLMYGNLLCISPSGNFHDAIWAMVSSRDGDLLNKLQLIMIELCTACNSMSDSAAMILLAHSSGRMIMVESPTYYRAYQPVLQALQMTNPDELPFTDQLIKGIKDDNRVPEYIEQSTLTQAEKLVTETLDKYQIKAWKHAFQNEIACIQGPPGTGKTFIGIKIVQTLLNMESRPKSPILVITYKNHALDEFLKETLKLAPTRVARVGGRSSEPDLQACSLQELSKKKHRNRVLSSAIGALFGEMDTIKEAIDRSGRKLARSRYVTLQTLLYFNAAQLESLIRGSKYTPRGVDTRRTYQALADNNPSELDKKILRMAYQHWCPSQDVIQEVEDGYHKAVAVELDILPDESEKETDTNKEDLLDEKDIEEMEKERQASGGHRKISLSEMINFNCDNQLKPEVKLFSIAKTFVSQLPYMRLMNTKDLWSLNNKDRIKLLQCLLVKRATDASDEFEQNLQQYQMLCTQKMELDNQHKVQVLSSMAIVGMTVTGASINQNLLSQLKPAIIIVEEAAEVLEAQLIALLGEWVKHLILIGDHKQLRPQVESYTLQKQYNFDLSMMERLINHGGSYATLNLQNRMRPEIAELLYDIYPELESNLERVSTRKKSECIEKSMFFWTHSEPETGGRSYSNTFEAKCALNMAVFFVQQGHKPHNITILAAYQGQVALLRRLMKQAMSDWSYWFPVSVDKDDRSNQIKIHTIDMYQGDENEIVIVSLVRSNKQRKPGFLKLLNRRCVAQSRAQCGMYMIGNIDTFKAVDHWQNFIKEMSKLDCVSETITLQCKRHPNCKVLVQSAEDIPLGKSFCNEPCIQLQGCGKHKCKNLCQPDHDHQQCDVPCTELFQPCQHTCPKCCYPSHDHRYCVERVDYTCSKCGNHGNKRCAEREESISCPAEVSFEFPCQHLGTKKCYEDQSNKKCMHDCVKKLNCGHLCNEKCSLPCNHSTCKTCKEIREMAERIKLELEERQRKDAIDEAKREIDEIKKEDKRSLELKLISNTDTTAAEYDGINLVMVNGLPKPVDREIKVLEIKKITFPMARIKWLIAKTNMFDPVQYERKFFHATTGEIEWLEQNNFEIKESKGRYGKGFYMSSNLCEFSLTNDGTCHKALVVDALLGKVKKEDPLKPRTLLSQLNSSKFDSIYSSNLIIANRYVGDEFAVEVKHQILPCYLVSYTVSASTSHTTSNVLELDALKDSSMPITKHHLVPTRELKPDDVLHQQLRLAESQFHRLLNAIQNDNTYEKQGEFQLDAVDYYVNPSLLKNFSQMEKLMKAKYKNEKEGDYILAFHGTSESSVESIVNNNFDLAKLATKTGDEGWYGAGIYLSEFPRTSLFYGEALILCRVLPGKSFDVSKENIKVGGELEPGYDSHRVNAQEDGYGEELVLFNPDQVLPCYVINYSKLIRTEGDGKKKKKQEKQNQTIVGPELFDCQ